MLDLVLPIFNRSKKLKNSAGRTALMWVLTIETGFGSCTTFELGTTTNRTGMDDVQCSLVTSIANRNH